LINVLGFFEPVGRNMMIRLVMFLLLTALILTGASAIVQRGWQVTHTGDPSAKVSKAQPVEIVASLYAWATSTPERELPALVRQISDRAPWLPTTSLHQAQVAAGGFVKDVLNSDTISRATAWVKNSVEGIASSVGIGGTAPAPAPAQVAAKAPESKPVPVPPVASAAPAPAPAPAPTSTPPAPPSVPVVSVPVVSAPVVSAPVATVQPVAPIPAPGSGKAAPAPTAAKVVDASPAPVLPPSAAPKPVATELWSAGSWSVSQKGCAIGGVAGTGVTLLIGPAEIAAWATGAVVLPATLRVVSTVIGAALVTGCAAGALVAPVVSK
jgi:hypothetical protein